MVPGIGHPILLKRAHGPGLGSAPSVYDTGRISPKAIMGSGCDEIVYAGKFSVFECQGVGSNRDVIGLAKS